MARQGGPPLDIAGILALPELIKFDPPGRMGPGYRSHDGPGESLSVAGYLVEAFHTRIFDDVSCFLVALCVYGDGRRTPALTIGVS